MLVANLASWLHGCQFNFWKQWNRYKFNLPLLKKRLFLGKFSRRNFSSPRGRPANESRGGLNRMCLHHRNNEYLGCVYCKQNVPSSDLCWDFWVDCTGVFQEIMLLWRFKMTSFERGKKTKHLRGKLTDQIPPYPSSAPSRKHTPGPHLPSVCLDFDDPFPFFFLISLFVHFYVTVGPQASFWAASKVRWVCVPVGGGGFSAIPKGGGTPTPLQLQLSRKMKWEIIVPPPRSWPVVEIFR